MIVEIERVRTTGVFSLDGQDFEVENNIWLVSHGDDLVILDAAHDASAIAAAVGGRKVSMIVCTHGHNDHINAALRLAGSSEWSRRHFGRWLFEDSPRAVVLTPRRWRRGTFSNPGAYRNEGQP